MPFPNAQQPLGGHRFNGTLDLNQFKPAESGYAIN
jgi:hypothetical protein